jgi:hypothetical protein
MAIIYKILFEVKLLHEFYLTEKDGTTIFTGADQPTRLEFLLDQYSKGRESINKDLLFEFPPPLLKEYEGYHLRLLPAYSGFKVAIQVNQKILADNSLVYEPFTPLPDNLGIYILFSKRNNAIDSYTNTRISNPLPVLYFFSNDEVISDRVFPFLTSTISTQRSGYDYEQGELVSFGPNDIRGYYLNDMGDQWNSFSGTGFANENDRLMLPLKFYYSFPAAKNVTKAEFVLQNRAGDTINSIVVNSTDRMDKVLVDVSSKKDLLTAPGAAAFTDFIFSLEVNGNDGYFNTHPVFFNDKFYNRALWGMASIHPKASNTAFDLFSDDGYLMKRRNSARIWTEAPVFEIPVKSRFTYWRYINDKGKELKLVPDLTDYLFKEDKMLLSIRPRSIAQSFFLLQKEGSLDKKYFPNPVTYDIKRDAKERLCFDIRVPRSDQFPVVL